MKSERRNWNDFNASDWSEVNVLVSALSKSSCPVKLISKRLHCKLLQQQQEKENCDLESYEILSPKRAHGYDRDREIDPIYDARNYSAFPSSASTTSEQNQEECDQTLNAVPKRHRRKAFLIQNEIRFSSPSKYHSNDSLIGSEFEPIYYHSQPKHVDIKEITSCRKKFRQECKQRYIAESNEREATLRLQAAKQRYDLHVAERKRREDYHNQMKRRREKIREFHQRQSSRSKLQMLMEAMETGGLLLIPSEGSDNEID